MEKFGVRDVEIFHLKEADLQAAESFVHELCTELAFGQGPPARALVETSAGDAFWCAANVRWPYARRSARVERVYCDSC
jgi:hypothetical protein